MSFKTRLILASAVTSLISLPALAEYLPAPDQVPQHYVPSAAVAPETAPYTSTATPYNGGYNTNPGMAAPSAGAAPTPGAPPMQESPYTPMPGSGYAAPATPPAPGMAPPPPHYGMVPPAPGMTPPPPAPGFLTPPPPAPAPVPQAMAPAPTSDFYISGGVGTREQEYFKSVEKEYNLKLLFAGSEGEFLASVNVTIADSKGNQVLAVSTEGPVLLVKLQPGTYKVHAEKEGQVFDSAIKTGTGLTSKNIHLKVMN